MTNQASEDVLIELAKKFDMDEYGTVNENGGYLIGEVRKLIRNEKLKLLAEVRERVIGDNDRYTITNPNSTRYGEPYESTMADKDELRAALTKMEAEL